MGAPYQDAPLTPAAAAIEKNELSLRAHGGLFGIGDVEAALRELRRSGTGV